MEAICTQEELRTIYPQPKGRAVSKVVSSVDEYGARFIAQAPFCILGTVSLTGEPDLTPRGGDPGFVQVLDAHTLLLADRPGNNRLDNLSNIAANPAVTLLFMIPGVDETLRVYGKAVILAAGTFDDRAAAGERRPSPTALKIAVDRAYFQCPKALMRARLWSDEARIDRQSLPTLGEILAAQTGDTGPLESQGEMLQRIVPEL